MMDQGIIIMYIEYQCYMCLAVLGKTGFTSNIEWQMAVKFSVDNDIAWPVGKT